MKTPSVIHILCLGLIPAAFVANAEDKAEPDSRTRAEIQGEVDVLNERIARREERLTELTNDMLAYDQRTETRMGEILTSIADVTDSVESGTNIARTKQDAIGALKECAQHYRDRAEALKRETMQRKPRITRKELFDDIGRFDQRVEERIDQIIMLVNSMQLHQGYDKWTGENGFWRWRDPRYYHNRRETSYTEREREQLLGELEEEIRTLQTRNREIRSIVETEITPQYRVMLLDELDDNVAKIERRQGQIVAVSFPDQPKTKPAGRAQGYTIDSVVEDMAVDLETDCQAIWNAYREITRERQILKILRDELAENLAQLEILDSQ